jgi:F-type H+-transporting ATPase subunit alpha
MRLEQRMGEKLLAKLRYASTAPTTEQIDGIKAMLRKKFDGEDIELEVIEDKSIGGGFIVSCKNYEYDWSDVGRARQLRAEINNLRRKSGDNDTGRIISMLSTKVEDFNLAVEDREVGSVIWVGDGIANIDGIDHAFYGEIIEFEDGTKGMAQDIRDDHIGCILFGNDTGIRQGTRAVRTYKEAGIPVGEAFIGRVIDALGAPIDGEGDIKESGYRPVEGPAPGIIERQSVNEPMETGILSIDTMFPIGRGQRELIIGDRQTGKTSIALDTIINQKGKDVICIYVAIGQKASTVAKIVNNLKKAGAMDYTIVVQATAADPAPLQYIAPYSGTSLAEYFMYKGKDVLIVYDDLSKHAVSYRTISLLLERSPGREAYPGDVFYLHSRLLERSSRLSKAAGGGSITALPIIETQAGDVSAYIPTNVISITDGQIYLESELFFEGQRPAVNVGLSVSRVGGAAQTKAMKKAAGSLRIDLAQYKEMEVFTQFSSDLDDNTKNMLTYGKSLMSLLKQPLGEPISHEGQVISLISAVSGKLFSGLESKAVKHLQMDIIAYFEKAYPDIIKKLATEKTYDDNLKEIIIAIASKYRESWIKGERPAVGFDMPEFNLSSESADVSNQAEGEKEVKEELSSDKSIPNKPKKKKSGKKKKK